MIVASFGLSNTCNLKKNNAFCVLLVHVYIDTPFKALCFINIYKNQFICKSFAAKFNLHDALNMESQLTEEEKMVRDSFRAYCDDKLMSRIIMANRNESRLWNSVSPKMCWSMKQIFQKIENNIYHLLQIQIVFQKYVR